MGVTRKFLNWYARLAPARGKSAPPYQHVIQIGDPTLRKVSEPVPLDSIKSKEIQGVIQKLSYVVNKYEAFGMSAPQIGVNIRIFVMQHTAKQLGRVPKDSAQMMGLNVVPFTVFVNPKLKVVNYQKVVRAEGCESVQGYTADVPRYKDVEISGYDQDGEPHSKTYKDWAARIAQHEMDHLDGKMYVDIMDKKTLTCICWEEVNLSKGKVVIPFSPE